MWKKLGMLLAAILLLWAPVWAADYVPPELPGDWREFSTADVDTLYFDAERCTYDPETDTAEVWMRTDTKTVKETYVTQCTIDFANRRIRTGSKGWLYKRGTVREFTNAVTESAIAKGTYGDKLAAAVAAYVKRDEIQKARQGA